jgi:RNA polymerase sigma factor (sigma-70 family)
MDPDWVTTSTILLRLRDFDDSLAWGLFVGRFRDPVVAFAQRMGLSAQEAEDASQETLVAFSRALREGRFDPARGRLSHWLFGFALRQAQRARMRAAQRGHVELGAEPEFWEGLGEYVSRTGWDEDWERAMTEQCIARARRELSPRTYEAFELSVKSGLPADEVALQLGIPVKAVYNAKHRALRRLREIRAELEDPL